MIALDFHQGTRTTATLPLVDGEVSLELDGAVVSLELRWPDDPAVARARYTWLAVMAQVERALYAEDGTTLRDVAPERQGELFDRECDRLGRSPPVVEGADVLVDPEGTLTALCAALGIPFSERMLSWPPGPRDSDGVWAPAWYDAVERSTGFGAPPGEAAPDLPDDLARIADQARPFYERLATHKLGA